MKGRGYKSARQRVGRVMADVERLTREIMRFGWQKAGSDGHRGIWTFFFERGDDELELYVYAEKDEDQEAPYSIEMVIGGKTMESGTISFEECLEYISTEVAKHSPSPPTTGADAPTSAALMACLSGLHWRISVLEDSTDFNK